MRIAVINWSSRIAGGAETYLQRIIPKLREHGHEIAFAHEVDTPEDRELISVNDAATWCISRSSVQSVLHNLSAWKPDLLFVHGLLRYDWLPDIVRTVPSAFFCHDYAGICISGTKTFRVLSTRACSRPFGWQCLVHYYPHHCGGWSPVTMWREYDRQSERLKLMRLGQAIVIASSAVREEFLRNGFTPDRVHLAPYMLSCEIAPSLLSNPREGVAWQLLFAGRMEWMKGGDILLDALPLACAVLDRPLHVTFSGDGTCRTRWERKASQLQSERLCIEFIGWQKDEAVQAILDRTHLLVLPSIWPEPFGMVGLEAACHGVPVAAFHAGGIPEWLKDGVNGFTAPANPPRASGLSEAIVKCLGDADTYRRLRSGAIDMAPEFTVARHLETLNSIFAGMLERKAA